MPASFTTARPREFGLGGRLKRLERLGMVTPYNPLGFMYPHSLSVILTLQTEMCCASQLPSPHILSVTLARELYIIYFVVCPVVPIGRPDYFADLRLRDAATEQAGYNAGRQTSFDQFLGEPITGGLVQGF